MFSGYYSHSAGTKFAHVGESVVSEGSRAENSCWHATVPVLDDGRREPDECTEAGNKKPS